jgi:class 3 adenylate cyclase
MLSGDLSSKVAKRGRWASTGGVVRRHRAGPGEILVSGSVRDISAGSGVSFVDLGERDLRGVPGSWRVYAVDR